jgi:hypothetical protein
MLYHGIHLRTTNASMPFFTMLEAAAGRAWLRTSPTKATKGIRTEDSSANKTGNANFTDDADNDFILDESPSCVEEIFSAALASFLIDVNLMFLEIPAS